MENFEHLLSQALVVLGVLSAAVPFLRHLASLTANKTDDQAVETAARFIHDLLGYIPTIEVNKALTVEEKKALEASKESK